MPSSIPSIPLPATNRTVSRIGLGGMPLSLAGRPDREAAKSVVKRAVEVGVTLIDTADVYALDDTDIGHNERLIAEALREVGIGAGNGSESPVLVATKGGMTRPEGRWERDGRPEHLRDACHASLERLGTECIDLYQLHCPDPAVPFVESVGALARLHEEGKVAAVGLSNVDVAQVLEAQDLVHVASVQNPFSPWDLGYRRAPIVEHCERHGILFLAYAPVGGSARVGALGANEALRLLGDELGSTPQELALAWLLSYSPVIVPIPGASRVASIESSVRAASLVIDPATRQRIERAFRTLPGAQGLLGRIASKVARTLGR